jgi:hypothetical protein
MYLKKFSCRRKALNRRHDIDPIRTVRGSGYALDDRFA